MKLQAKTLRFIPHIFTAKLNWKLHILSTWIPSRAVIIDAKTLNTKKGNEDYFLCSFLPTVVFMPWWISVTWQVSVKKNKSKTKSFRQSLFQTLLRCGFNLPLIDFVSNLSTLAVKINYKLHKNIFNVIPDL